MKMYIIYFSVHALQYNNSVVDPAFCFSSVSGWLGGGGGDAVTATPAPKKVAQPGIGKAYIFYFLYKLFSNNCSSWGRGSVWVLGDRLSKKQLNKQTTVYIYIYLSI